MCTSYEKYRKKKHLRMLGFSDNLTLKNVSKNFFITSIVNKTDLAAML